MLLFTDAINPGRFGATPTTNATRARQVSYFRRLTSQKSQSMIAPMGPRKMAYADIKFRKLPADARIFQGTRHHDRIAQMICPRRRLMYCGASAVRSLAAEMELAEMLTPREARAKENAAKKRQARLVQWLISTIGSQGMSPP
ncbi:hypothetical protein CNMCM6457_007486 [Aspergillus fumigatiaffinis]|nr:hypothetical protein CNMCM6457_007486 [Aspergillus fumigatiaffinis]